MGNKDIYHLFYFDYSCAGKINLVTELDKPYILGTLVGAFANQ